MKLFNIILQFVMLIFDDTIYGRAFYHYILGWANHIKVLIQEDYYRYFQLANFLEICKFF